jgi:protein-S-isoprenylcysteine O-methyltransferase
MANGLALMEYLLTLYFRPSLKSFPYISFIGKSCCLFLSSPRYVCGFAGIIVVFLGQFLRSAAMIKAASNFSHAVAFRKHAEHQLVTDGVYTLVTSLHLLTFGFQNDL